MGAVAIVGFNDQIPMDKDNDLDQYILEMRKKFSQNLGYLVCNFTKLKYSKNYCVFNFL